MIKKTVLENGLRLLTVPKTDGLSVSVLVLVGVGTNYETEKINGLSHFLEHMCFKGTDKRARAIDISSELDALGAEYNAFTGREYTGYYVSCLPERIDEALDVLSDLYLNPRLDEGEIEKEKGVIGEEINRSFDNPSRRVQDNFTELAFGNSPLGWNTLGTASRLKQLTRGDFLEYRKKYYYSGNTVVVVSGKFDPGTITQKIASSFTGITIREKDVKSSEVIFSAESGVGVEYRESEQSNLVLGFHTFGEKHPDHPVAEVLAGVLGGTMSSRLWQKIREEMGAAYSIGAFQTSYVDYGYLAVAGGVQSGRLEEVVKVILAEIVELKESPVDEKELSRVKDSLIGTAFLNLETPFDLATYYGMDEVRGEELLDPIDWAKKIRAVTASEVQDLARKIFIKERMVLSIVGPHRDKNVFEEISLK